jgi:hypothetical protein
MKKGTVIIIHWILVALWMALIFYFSSQTAPVSNKQIFKSATLDPYYYLFLKGYTYRECCYECKYANTQREGDFTIGDFWGIEKFHLEIKTHDGVSVVMINTQRGLAVFDEISDKFSLIETTIDNACAQNGQLVHPVVLDNLCEEVLNTFCDFGFSGVVRKFSKLTRNERIIARIKLLIPKPVKIVVKNVLKYVSGSNT